MRENARWCDLVCRASGVTTRWHDRVWATTTPAPLFYPDAITLHEAATADDVLAVLGGTHECAVKDSFALLGLGPHGFVELFSASWVHRAPAPVPPAVQPFTVVAGPRALAEWAVAAGVAESLGPAQLSDPAVTVLGLRQGDRTVAGAVAHRAGAVVGVSNVFSAEEDHDATWAGVVAAVTALHPGAALVGYERGEELAAALRQGFTDVGPLRVWLRPG